MNGNGAGTQQGPEEDCGFQWFRQMPLLPWSLPGLCWLAEWSGGTGPGNGPGCRVTWQAGGSAGAEGFAQSVPAAYMEQLCKRQAAAPRGQMRAAEGPGLAHLALLQTHTQSLCHHMEKDCKQGHAGMTLAKWLFPAAGSQKHRSCPSGMSLPKSEVTVPEGVKNSC